MSGSGRGKNVLGTGSGSSPSDSQKKEDIGWQYCTTIDGNKLKTQCRFCDKKLLGGGVTRFKYHITGGSKDVARCKYCPDDVREEILASMDARKEKVNLEKKKKKAVHEQLRARGSYNEEYDYEILDEDADEDDDDEGIAVPEDITVPAERKAYIKVMYFKYFYLYK